MEQIACGHLEPSTEDVVKPTHSTKSTDPSRAGKFVASKNGTFDTTSVVSAEPVVVIQEEFLTNVGELPAPPPQTLANIVRPSAHPLGNVS